MEHNNPFMHKVHPGATWEAGRSTRPWPWRSGLRPRRRGSFDAVVLDPPRTGLAPARD
ncbi:MAG: hypothetical protein MZU95_15780 [Desulfomicrobium escambiense]|nr:hypothetical protein [Desulfomicrobium escambiense]